MKLCSMTGGRLGLWRNRGRRDDRPFPPRQILPIAGFRGNRVMYGESWWTPEEEHEQEEVEEEMEGSYNPRALEPEEPVYSEPNFARGGEELVPPHLSSPDSGYLSFGRPGLSSCSSDTEGSLASLAPGAEPLARLLPPYIPPPPPRAPSFPGPNSKPSPPIRNPSLSTPPVSSPHPQDSHSPPPNRPQTPTSAKNQSQLSVPASQRLHHPLDLSSVSEPLTEDLLLRLLQEHQQVAQGNILASTVVPKLPDGGDHALLLRGQGATTATNSLLIQVASQLDARGDEGAGEVVRAVAELLHLAGGQLACALMVAPGEIRIHGLSSRLCSSSPLFTEPQDLLPPVLRESLGLEAEWGEESQLAASLVSCLARLRVCPEDVLRLLAGVRLLQMAGQERQAEVVLGLEEGSLLNCEFELEGVAGQLAARALGAVLRRAARLATSCLRGRQAGTLLIAQLENEAENPYGEVGELPHPSLLGHLASTCQFGFLLHLLSLSPPSPPLHALLSPSLPTTSVHCIVQGSRHHLAVQLRELGLLELLHDSSGQLWQPLPLPHLLPLLSWLLPIHHRGGNNQLVEKKLLELLGAVGYQGGAVLEREIWQKLTALRERRMEAAALRLQKAWREKKRDSKTELLGAEAERSLIETVLQKYERLQRQSESLAYSFYSDSSGYTLYSNSNSQSRRKEQKLGALDTDRAASVADEIAGKEEEGLRGGSTRVGGGAESRLEAATATDPCSLGPRHHQPPSLQELDPEQEQASSLFRALPCTSTPEPTDSFTDQIVRQTSQFFGLNLAVPPPLPPRRNYLVRGGTKVFQGTSKAFP